MASDDGNATGGPPDPYDAFAHAMANAAMNATNQQQQIEITAQAATTMGVSTLYSVDTATLGIASAKLLKK